MSETATKKKEPGMATLVIVLFAICAATALLLGLTNYVTAPFIAANNEKTTQEAMAAVLPANSYDEVEYTGGDAMVQAVYKAGDEGYVVEVLSPSTAKNDRWQKARTYAAHGVPEYWIVDPMNQTVEVYALQDGQYTLLDTYLHHPDYVLQTMGAEEKAALVTSFRCHLYDDFLIRLEDIFSGLI